MPVIAPEWRSKFLASGVVRCSDVFPAVWQKRKNRRPWFLGAHSPAWLQSAGLIGQAGPSQAEGNAIAGTKGFQIAATAAVGLTGLRVGS